MKTCPRIHKPSGLRCTKNPGHPRICVAFDEKRRGAEGFNDFGFAFFGDERAACGYCGRSDCGAGAVPTCEQSIETSNAAAHRRVARGR